MFALVVDDELVPVVFDEPEDDALPVVVSVLEPDPEPEPDPDPDPDPELVELLELVPDVSPVVPVAVPEGEVVPVAVLDELPSAAIADAVGSIRSGTVLGTGSETLAPPQALSTSPPRRAPRSPAGRPRLAKASFRLGPCDARRSGSR